MDFKNLMTTGGTILCRPLKHLGVTTRNAHGLSFISNKTELEALEVLVGNSAKDNVFIIPKSTAYIRASRYTEGWAKEKMTTPGFEEEVDGKLVPVQFIVVPLSEVVMFALPIPVPSKPEPTRVPSGVPQPPLGEWGIQLPLGEWGK
jgi:hypothetical protein